MTVQTANDDLNNGGDDELEERLRSLWLGIESDFRTIEAELCLLA